MAIYSCHISNVSRAAGSSSLASLSYIAAIKVRDERLGETFAYGRGERVMSVDTLLPVGASEEYADPVRLFNELEKVERAANARVAKKIMVALPREFDFDLQREVVSGWVQDQLVARGFACVVAIHHDVAGNNPHAHVLVANRAITKTGKWAGKSRRTYALDEAGNRIPQIDPQTGEQKIGRRGERMWKRVLVESNPLDEKAMLERLRSSWAGACNAHLAAEDRIDHRSLAAQGVDRVPTVHEGYAARGIEARGGMADRCEINRDIVARNELAGLWERLIAQGQVLIERIRAQQVQIGEQLRERYEAAIRRIERVLGRGDVGEAGGSSQQDRAIPGPGSQLAGNASVVEERASEAGKRKPAVKTADREDDLAVSEKRAEAAFAARQARDAKRERRTTRAGCETPTRSETATGFSQTDQVFSRPAVGSSRRKGPRL